MKDIAIFSAMFGGYDTIIDPQVVAPNADYFFFTDASEVRTKVWEPIKVERVHTDPRRCARYIKAMPHLWLPPKKYKVLIWHDSNIYIAGDVNDILRHMKANDILCLKHPGSHQCLYQEAHVCKRCGLDDKSIIDKQTARYKAKGYPKKAGLADTSFLVRANNKRTIAFNEMWWHEISNYSRRDQLSFNFCLNRLNVKHKYFAVGHRPNPWFVYRSHKVRDRRKFV